MARHGKARGRAINGILVLDKPVGMSSNAALQQARRLFDATKAGHTGSLDPLASGVLPLCFGEATKLSRYLLDADKGYSATFTFGRRTATGDAEGEILSEQAVPNLTRDEVISALSKFEGDIRQVPSMYSALKHQGQPLYKLARAGIEIEREARTVTLHEIHLRDFRPGEFPEADVDVLCSKGTYIRSLAEDVGDVLGCGAFVSRLRRTKAGVFIEAQAVTLDTLRELRGEQAPEVLDTLLRPPAQAVGHMLEVRLEGGTLGFFLQGQTVMDPCVLKDGRMGDTVCVANSEGEFVGIAEVLEAGRIAPRRLVASVTTESSE